MIDSTPHSPPPEIIPALAPPTVSTQSRVDAEVRRLDDLRVAEAKRHDALREMSEKLRDAESKRIDAVMLAESRRIDALFAQSKNGRDEGRHGGQWMIGIGLTIIALIIAIENYLK